MTKMISISKSKILIYLLIIFAFPVQLLFSQTDTVENKKAILGFVNRINKNIPVEFIDYNQLAANNYRRLGIPFPLNNL